MLECTIFVKNYKEEFPASEEPHLLMNSFTEGTSQEARKIIPILPIKTRYLPLEKMIFTLESLTKTVFSKTDNNK